MRRIVVAAMSAAALLLAAPAARGQDPKVDQGIKVYAANTCKMCHSIAGVGNAKGPLDGVGTKLTVAEIKEWIVDPVGMTTKTKAERKPYMPKGKPLSAEDVDALVAYMASLKKK
jgi:mono/diheme cytochrome c family protein